jgi:hypothetical protein
MRVEPAKAIDLRNQRVETDRTKPVSERKPAFIDAATASHVDEKEGVVTPEIQLEYPFDQRSSPPLCDAHVMERR